MSQQDPTNWGPLPVMAAFFQAYGVMEWFRFRARVSILGLPGTSCGTGSLFLKRGDMCMDLLRKLKESVSESLDTRGEDPGNAWRQKSLG